MPRIKKDSGIEGIFLFSVLVDIEADKIFQEIKFRMNGKEFTQKAPKAGKYSEIRNSMYGNLINSEIKKEAPEAKLVLLEINEDKKELTISYYNSDKTLIVSKKH